MALPYDWRYRLLHKMGASANSTTISCLNLWAKSEGMDSRYNNWLATTMNCCGGVSINRVGVRAYPNLDMGVEATWRTLSGTRYRGVVAAFRRGGPAMAIWRAIHDSPWCSGCQGGHYPVVLYNALTGSNPMKAFDPAPGTHPSPPNSAPDINLGPAIVRSATAADRHAAGFVALRGWLMRLPAVRPPKQWRG